MSIAHVYPVDDIDTDRIIPGKYTKTVDVSQLAAHVLEDLDPGFAARVQPGDVLVVGENFGCGSSREQAPVALKAAGISAIIARSYARIFYRNAINIGLLVMEAPDHDIAPGHVVDVDAQAGVVRNLSTGKTHQATRLPKIMLDILTAGGLVPYMRRHGDFANS